MLSIIQRSLTGLMLLIFSIITTQGQAPGSSSSYTGLGIAAGGTQGEGAETVYIGPGTYQIDGTWEIYSKYIVIDLGAIITGSGTIQIYNATLAGGAGGRTYIDGNNSSNPIEVNVVLNNASGMEITAIAGPFTNVTTNNTVYFGKDLNLAVNGADIWLDADVIGDLRFDNNATISNYSVNRMVITNNVNMSHMVKDAFGPGTFFFPVGIADGDYTPASLTGSGPYHVSVTNYTASASIEQTPAEGMDRTWHIYGGTATSMSLYHNSPSTDGSSFVEPNSFITQYQGSSVWSIKAASDRVSLGVNTTSNPASAIPSTATDLAYFTKTSDLISPLPIQLVSFTAMKHFNTSLLNWIVTQEVNSKGYEVERSTTGSNWKQIGFVESKTLTSASAKTAYEFTDNNPQEGINYYRFKQIDVDGKYMYSPIRTVTFGSGLKVNVYPNPTVQEVYIDGLTGDESVQVYDAAGNLVKNIDQAGTSKLQLNLDQVESGLYFIKVKGQNDEVNVYQIVKK